MKEEIILQRQKGRWWKTFLGIRQRHTYWLYKVIDDVLNENKQIAGIIEIGTGAGALSLLLGLECYERGLKPLLTYDIKDWVKEKSGQFYYKEPKLFKLLGIKFVIRDCFSEASTLEMKEYADKPVLLFCDGGKKKREFKELTHLLPIGSIVAAHDWNNEILLEHIQETTDKYAMLPVCEAEWDSPPDYIETCFWRKTL